MDRELAAMQEEEAALERQVSELAAALKSERELTQADKLPLLERHFQLSERLREVRALKAQRAAHSERADFRARRQARTHSDAEHVPGGGSQGSSGTASRDGSSGSADTADLQRDLTQALGQLELGGAEQQAGAPASGQQAEAPAGGMGGGVQQAEAPAGGTAAAPGQHTRHAARRRCTGGRQ